MHGTFQNSYQPPDQITLEQLEHEESPEAKAKRLFDKWLIDAMADPAGNKAGRNLALFSPQSAESKPAGC